jgi:hypothetical protein
LDQVADMMVANAMNLVVTIKPANQRNSLQRNGNKINNKNHAGFSQIGFHHQNYPAQYTRGGESSSSSQGKLTNGSGGRVYPTSGVIYPPSSDHDQEYSSKYIEGSDEDEIVEHYDFGRRKRQPNLQQQHH